MANEPHRTRQRTRSERQRAASRENGKKGGRPRKQRDFSDFGEVRPPPGHPLDLGYWMQRVLALDARRIDLGRGDKAVSKTLRSYARAMSQLMTPAIMMAALDPDGDWQRDVAVDKPMPEHPFGVAYWFLLWLARGVERVIQGEADPHGVEIRAQASAYVQMIPPDAMYEAQRQLRGERDELENDDGPVETPPKEPTHGCEQRYLALGCELPGA